MVPARPRSLALTSKEFRSLSRKLHRATRHLRMSRTAKLQKQSHHLDKMIGLLYDVERLSDPVLVRIKRKLHLLPGYDD